MDARDYSHLVTPASLASFWRRVNKAGPVSAKRPDLGPCWLIRGADNGNGYVQVRLENVRIVSHVFAYFLEHGTIPAGLTIDHLCFVKRCVRPTHLEAVTMRVNTLRGNAVSAIEARQTHCKYGHALPATRNKFGRRVCQPCVNAASARRRSELRPSAETRVQKVTG